MQQRKENRQKVLEMTRRPVAISTKEHAYFTALLTTFCHGKILGLLGLHWLERKQQFWHERKLEDGALCCGCWSRLRSLRLRTASPFHDNSIHAEVKFIVTTRVEKVDRYKVNNSTWLWRIKPPTEREEECKFTRLANQEQMYIILPIRNISCEILGADCQAQSILHYLWQFLIAWQVWLHKIVSSLSYEGKVHENGRAHGENFNFRYFCSNNLGSQSKLQQHHRPVNQQACFLWSVETANRLVNLPSWGRYMYCERLLHYMYYTCIFRRQTRSL